MDQQRRGPDGRYIRMPNAPDTAAQAVNDAADAATPEYVTRDDIAAIVNAAVSSHLKRSLDKAITASLETALTPIKQRLEASPVPAADESRSKQSPEVAALQKQLADMQQAMRAAQDEAASEKRRAREEKAYGALKSELNGKVRPEALDAAADLIFHARKKVTVDDDGNILFSVRSSLGNGLPEEDRQFPLSDGVKQFLKSPEAALFVPPPSGNNATGAKPQSRAVPTAQRPAVPRYDTPAVSTEEKARRALEILAAKNIELP